MKRIMRWWKRLNCKHVRTAFFYPEQVSCVLPTGHVVKHPTVKVKGCLICHKMWMSDYGE